MLYRNRKLEKKSGFLIQLAANAEIMKNPHREQHSLDGHQTLYKIGVMPLTGQEDVDVLIWTFAAGSGFLKKRRKIAHAYLNRAPATPPNRATVQERVYRGQHPCFSHRAVPGRPKADVLRCEACGAKTDLRRCGGCCEVCMCPDCRDVLVSLDSGCQSVVCGNCTVGVENTGWCHDCGWCVLCSPPFQDCEECGSKTSTFHEDDSCCVCGRLCTIIPNYDITCESEDEG